MSTAEREPWRQSSVTTASDESALMEKVAGIVSRTMSDHYGDKLTFEVGVERHFESWDNGDVDPYLYVEIVFSGDEQYIMKEISKRWFIDFSLNVNTLLEKNGISGEHTLTVVDHRSYL